MVERGQVLERMITFEGPQGRLEGLWQGGGVAGIAKGKPAFDDDDRQRQRHRDRDVDFDEEGAGRPIVFCPPHPRLGGNMDSPVCAELIWTLGHLKHPSLRFNYAGVGASQGTVTLPSLPPPTPLPLSALQPLVDDARAAIAHVKATLGGPVVVVGVSVGALVAALVAHDDDVSEGVFIAPVTSVAAFDVDGKNGRVYVGSEDGFVDRDALGDSAVVVAGANHTFSRGLPDLARAVAEQLGHRRGR